jgi:phage-related minor tail protein
MADGHGSNSNFPDVFNQPLSAAPFQTQDLAAMKALLDQINGSAGNLSKSLASGFASATSSGKNFNDTLATIAQSLAKIVLRAGAKSLAEGLVDSLGSVFSGLSGSGGAVKQFAEGGIVTSPTFFGAGQSVGVMGERGAEAIMPLARGADGRLGVAAQGKQSSASITVNIAAHDVDSFRRSEAQITGALARAVARGQRSL